MPGTKGSNAMTSSERSERRRAHFSGASAIVTGAGSGIGAALAGELVARGASVLVTDLDGEAAERVAEGLRRPSPDMDGRTGGTPPVAAATLDVTDASAVAETVGRFAVDRRGLDFIFNNAGIGVGGPVETLALEHWHKVVDVNLYGVVNGVAAAYPRMVEQRRGHIVNTASLSGLVPSPGLVPYSLTKHAVVGLSVGLRLEAVAHGVRVSVVCPGLIETPLLDKGNGVDVPGVPPLDVRAMLTAVMGKPYPAASLASDVLDGVAQNRPIIVSPAKARPIWLLYRLSPGLLLRLVTLRSGQFAPMSRPVPEAVG
jgi:NAD(P)-dependent dehydrogenase (short-subunit alcohol dehydrogenase family)